MSDVISSESMNTLGVIDSKIMGILNPTMHHHDLLQSYVRAPAESTSNSKQSGESENLDKTPSSLGTCLDTEFTDGVDKESRVDGDKKKRKNDKQQPKSKSDKLSVESEMSIQKKKK
ncbi:hypothetical protein WH47_06241 [Habropoda laboriosa]|uniref:Uncharacterized protein n=1 Tax=Habropoda laboriosa TaxID=597456 RepID=A0A0L7RJY7_9HYME|nr:PREDICTED: uncharacterized protein LOC108578684 [Habropoda laboriosa]KOC71180.1 hypothetical protein WH47_06241 [Habropoda laboriosa]